MKLNTSLAWNRVKRDLKDRNFISPSGIVNIIEANLGQYLEILKDRFESGCYHPHDMEVIEVPKGRGLIRTGSYLELEDNIFYTSLIQECYSQILKRIQWAQNDVDFGYIASEENLTSSQWFKNQFSGWDQFRERSKDLIQKGYQYIILTDIAAFYDNIDIATLISDLRSCEIESSIVNNIRDCLNKWCKIKGIPQGNSASDLLGKLYLDTVDKGMQNAHFRHLRYVDDIRIFCRTMPEAKQALIELSKLLRKRGLYLQSTKTKILLASEALREIEGVQPIIKGINEKLRSEILELFNENSYSSEENSEDQVAPLEIIKETMKSHFLEGNDEKFNKTLFHFLINQLIFYKESFAVKYCLSILDKHPEETGYILRYSKAFSQESEYYFDNLNQMSDQLLTFLVSQDAVYDYQNFQILKWLRENIHRSSEKLLISCRKFAFDNNRPYYLRAVAIEILGSLGNDADFDKIEDHINLLAAHSEKAGLICCLQKREKSKRNSFLGRINDDGAIVKMAVEYVKGK